MKSRKPRKPKDMGWYASIYSSWPNHIQVKHLTTNERWSLPYPAAKRLAKFLLKAAAWAERRSESGRKK